MLLGHRYDVVVTGGGPEGRTMAVVLDEYQHGCGPVIEDPETGWLYWLVPPGSARTWSPHTHGVCLGSPRTIRLPSPQRTAPSGAYWLRPYAHDRPVPVQALRELLARFRPVPTPHTTLAAHLNQITRSGTIPPQASRADTKGPGR
ncbi:hypothetical protein AB0F77_31995 [Streptomyces sp. NPDC026672]|uniref:hypothetical protein n=1 Tax=unclassified Streptomyces TaxID=2593676 RepID=UPI0033C9510E